MHNLNIYGTTAVILLFLALPIWIVPSIALPQHKDVQLTSAEANYIVLEYIPAFYQPDTIKSNGSVFLRYNFEGCTQGSDHNSGSPEILKRSILLKFRGVNGNSAEILNVSYEEISNVLLAPTPYYHKDELGPVYDYSIDQAAYGTPGYVPEQLASIANVGETRGAFLGELRIFPFQYDPVRRVLRKYNRIVVRVNFGKTENLQKNVRQIHTMALNDELFEGEKNEFVSAGKTSLRNSILSSGQWYKFTISDNGMYKLTGQMLLDAGIPSATNPESIKIYGNGGFEVPLSVSAHYEDDLLQNAIYIYDGGTVGQLDAADYVIFYGKATKGWNYNSTSKIFSHYINHFAETNVYWLTFSGSQTKTMKGQASIIQPLPYRPSTVGEKVFREDDKVNVLSSGIEWLGESFNTGGQIVYRHSLAGLDITQPITYKFNLAARSPAMSQFNVYEHDSLLTTLDIGYDPYNSDYPPIYFDYKTVSHVPSFLDEESRLRFVYSTGSISGTGYIDWYEIFYRRFLTAQNDQFHFCTHDSTVTAEYNITGFSGGQVFVFDVTKFDSVVLISNPRISADTCSFQLDLNSGNVREFYVVGQNGFKTPGALSLVPNQNLHGDINEAQYIIITHPDFITAAQRLKTYREQSGSNYLKTLVVDVNQIYNEFGGGLLTPAAIRNYLRYVYTNWSVPPQYVLLFGDGDYDYKRILGEPNPNWIPPWESRESFSPLDTYTSDDLYGIFFGGDRVNLGIGRLIARSLQDANTMVDKIIEYETNAVTDPWKLRFTFVADDGPQAPGITDGIRHTAQADNISKLVPPLFEKKKIYLYEYPTVYTSGGRRKPTVNTAIQNAINQGTLVLNFTGHGNPRLWTHEAVFVRESDFPMLHNKGKYFFLVAATCNYSNFDMLTEQSGGELLTSMTNAGAIGVFSASRPVNSDDNYSLNQTVYKYLLDIDRFGRILRKRLGDVTYLTKQDRTLPNDRKYFLLGDPALVIAFPNLSASVDSINHIANSQPIYLKALEHASVSATVHDTALSLPFNFSGTTEVNVYDANRSVTITAPDINPFTYTTSGSILFRGQASVKNGVVGTDFIVPKDISYSNDSGRITLYFWNDSVDGAGYTTKIRINGTDSTASPDAQGPQIQLYIDKKSFRPGDIVGTSPLLIAELFDSSGINTSGAGIGHLLEAWLDNNPESIDLTNYYKSKIDTYKEGVAEYSLGALSEGTHKLRMRAWDTYNNSSTNETVFNVLTGEGLKLSNVFNYPNPFSSATVFTFEHNQVTSVEAEVKIYTLAGRLIQSLRKTNISEQFIRIPWDGLDKDGDILANGIYLYKVIAKTQDGRFTSEAFGKLSVLK